VAFQRGQVQWSLTVGVPHIDVGSAPQQLGYHRETPKASGGMQVRIVVDVACGIENALAAVITSTAFSTSTIWLKKPTDDIQMIQLMRDVGKCLVPNWRMPRLLR
jgi:hypothetical protein